MTGYPYPTELVASPSGSRIAWVFNEKGVRNVWAAEGPGFAARRLTNNTSDDGQELTNLEFSADGNYIVYASGPLAAPAIPQLAQMLYSDRTANRAAFALVDIGTNSLPFLIEALQNGNRSARLEAALAVGEFRGAGEAAVPALVACMKYDDDSVRVNALAPCTFATPLVNKVLAYDDTYRATVEAGIPMGRVGQPDEIVGAAVFLAADASSMVTGHILAVDGGYLAR